MPGSKTELDLHEASFQIELDSSVASSSHASTHVVGYAGSSAPLMPSQPPQAPLGSPHGSPNLAEVAKVVDKWIDFLGSDVKKHPFLERSTHVFMNSGNVSWDHRDKKTIKRDLHLEEFLADLCAPLNLPPAPKHPHPVDHHGGRQEIWRMTATDVQTLQAFITVIPDLPSNTHRREDHQFLAIQLAHAAAATWHTDNYAQANQLIATCANAASRCSRVIHQPRLGEEFARGMRRSFDGYLTGYDAGGKFGMLTLGLATVPFRAGMALYRTAAGMQKQDKSANAMMELAWKIGQQAWGTQIDPPANRTPEAMEAYHDAVANERLHFEPATVDALVGMIAAHPAPLDDDGKPNEKLLATYRWMRTKVRTAEKPAMEEKLSQKLPKELLGAFKLAG